MATIPAHYRELNDLTRRLGLTWGIDEEYSDDSDRTFVYLETMPRDGKDHGHESEPLEMGTTVDLLEYLLQRGLLPDLAQPTILQRLERLEEAFSEIVQERMEEPTTAEAQESDTSQKAGVDLDELCARASAIGTCVRDEGREIYYFRYRHQIPGTRYKFYFITDNAMNPQRRHYGAKYTFAPSELDELARWIAHDEKIFAESNRLYGVS